jgi:hypothetical protein
MSGINHGNLPPTVSPHPVVAMVKESTPITCRFPAEPLDCGMRFPAEKEIAGRFGSASLGP